MTGNERGCFTFFFNPEEAAPEPGSPCSTPVYVWGVCVFCPVAERIPGLSREGHPGETGLRAAARASSTFCTELTLGFEGGDVKATSWGNLSPVKVATFVSTLVAGYFGVARNHVAGSAPPHWPDRSSQ